jgi:hypothetical protein
VDVPELPDVLIAITPTALRADHGPERWKKGDSGAVTGLVVSAETLEQGPVPVLAAVLHDAAHLLSWVRGIQDTTMRGAYHNQKYLTAAEEVGLEWPADAERSPTRGFVDPRLTEAALRRHAPDLKVLEDVIPQTLPHLVIPPSQSTRRTERLTARCQCDPPRLIRISQTAMSAGPITCGVCGQRFA